MKKFRNLLIMLEKEETAEDVERKIVSLDRMINDHSTTEGEKNNARTLKATLENRLKTEFSDTWYNTEDYDDELTGFEKLEDDILTVESNSRMNRATRWVLMGLKDAWKELIKDTGASVADRDDLIKAIISTIHIIHPSIADILAKWDYKTNTYNG